MTAPSHGGGEGEEAELLCHQERPFWFQEALAPSWGQDAGGRGGAFLQSEPFPICFTGWLGVRGGAVILLCWSLAQWGWRPDRNLTLDREPMLGWWRHSAEGLGRGKRKALLLIFWVPSEGRGYGSLQLTFNDDRFA